MTTTQRSFLWLFAIVVLLLPVVVPAQEFTYWPPGDLIPGSGTGRVDHTVYLEDMRFPIELAPAYANSQVWGVGGSRNPGGSECDAVNYSYPWRDNFCETRNFPTSQCPTGKGHQGQDIRASTCVDRIYWAVATESGRVSKITRYNYRVELQGDSGFRHAYLHMHEGSLVVKFGDRVKAGDRIGLISDTDKKGGSATFYHLHYELISGGTIYPPYMSLVNAYKKVIDGTTATDVAWYLRNSNTNGGIDVDFTFGHPSDERVVGDWDGDGIETPGVFRDGRWFLRNSNTTGAGDVDFWFGSAGDTVVVGDWDGDGIDTVGVFRDGRWLLRNANTSGGVDVDFWFGSATDVPVVGDWDGDGTDTVGVYRAGRWLLRNSNSNGGVNLDFWFGSAGDTVVVGDWDGDGTDTIGVYRAGRWLLRNSNSNGGVNLDFWFGSAGDAPLVGDWNYDGIDTIGVAREV